MQKIMKVFQKGDSDSLGHWSQDHTFSRSVLVYYLWCVDRVCGKCMSLLNRCQEWKMTASNLWTSHSLLWSLMIQSLTGQSRKTSLPIPKNQSLLFLNHQGVQYRILLVLVLVVLSLCAAIGFLETSFPLVSAVFNSSPLKVCILKYNPNRRQTSNKFLLNLKSLNNIIQ